MQVNEELRRSLRLPNIQTHPSSTKGTTVIHKAKPIQRMARARVEFPNSKNLAKKDLDTEKDRDTENASDEEVTGVPKFKRDRDKEVSKHNIILTKFKFYDCS